jgi:hypothetical protein
MCVLVRTALSCFVVLATWSLRVVVASHEQHARLPAQLALICQTSCDCLVAQKHPQFDSSLIHQQEQLLVVACLACLLVAGLSDIMD